MKKHRLEDISKRQVFTKPPEGYFETLPGIIQAKTANKPGRRAKIYWMTALKLVPAAALLVVVALYSGLLNTQEETPGFEEMLSEVTSEDIIDYLEELDITNDEILEEVDLAALTLELNDVRDPLMETLNIEDEALMQLYDDFEIQDSLL